MRRLVLGLCLGAGAILLAASSSVYTTYGTGNGTAQAFVQLCPKSDGTQNAVPCPTGGGGGSQAASGPAVPCQGGSGSVISSVSTTVTTVCSAGTTRGYATVVANSGVSGNVVAVGTFDGTTPTASHYDFVLYGGIGWDTAGMGTVPAGPIQVLSLGGTVTLTASAIQTGAAP